MPKFVHVYTGPDGKSVIDEREFEMTEFQDTEGAHGLSSPIEQTPAMASGCSRGSSGSMMMAGRAK